MDANKTHEEKWELHLVTIGWKSKKLKRETCTWASPKNEENCGPRDRCWYESLSEPLERSATFGKGTRKIRKWMNNVTTPVSRPGDPLYISFLKPLMTIRSDRLEVFLTSDKGHYTFLLYIRKTQSRGWKKRTNEQTQTCVSPKRKKWGSLCDTVHSVS